MCVLWLWVLLLCWVGCAECMKEGQGRGLASKQGGGVLCNTQPSFPTHTLPHPVYLDHLHSINTHVPVCVCV